MLWAQILLLVLVGVSFLDKLSRQCEVRQINGECLVGEVLAFLLYLAAGTFSKVF